MTIDNWKIMIRPNGTEYVIGDIYGSPDFEDGTSVHTSTIVNKNIGVDTLYVTTKNHTYRLPFFNEHMPDRQVPK